MKDNYPLQQWQQKMEQVMPMLVFSLKEAELIWFFARSNDEYTHAHKCSL